MLLELGDLQGRSAASYLREMLDAAMPMLRHALPVLRAAAAHEEEQPEALVRQAQEAIRGTLGELEANVDQLNLLELLAGYTPGSASNDVVEGAAATTSGASEDGSTRKRARGRKRS